MQNPSLNPWPGAVGTWGGSETEWNRHSEALLTSIGISPRTTVALGSDGAAMIATGCVAIARHWNDPTEVTELETIGLDLPEGRMIVLTLADAAHPITLKHQAVDGSTAGELDLAGGEDVELTAVDQAVILQRIGDRWREVVFKGLWNVRYVSKPVDGNSHTLVPADAFLTAAGGVLTVTTLYCRHVTPANAIGIQQPDALAAGLVFALHQAADQAGTVTISRETAGTINGAASVALAGPGATAQLIVHETGPAKSSLEGETAEASDLGDRAVANHRSKKVALSGAQTLNAATAPSGCTVVNTGAAATWTVPSRVTAADSSVGMVIHNRGSGAITLSASGVTIKGATEVAVDGSATLEWEHDGSSTQYCWARAT